MRPAPPARAAAHDDRRRCYAASRPFSRAATQLRNEMLYKAHEKVVHARQRRLQEYAGRLRRVLVSERITLIREFGPPPSPTREPRPQNGHARNRPTQELSLIHI